MSQARASLQNIPADYTRGHDSVSNPKDSKDSVQGTIPPPCGKEEELTSEYFSGEFDNGTQIENVPHFEPRYAMRRGLDHETKIPPGAADIRPCCLEKDNGQNEIVCGYDDRVQIPYTMAAPWRHICQLIVHFPSFTGRCTGWLAGTRGVITAGHCVYRAFSGEWAESIEVIPGCNGGSKPFGSQISTDFRTNQEYMNTGSPYYDYGAVILPDSTMSLQAGWFGFAAKPDYWLLNALANNSGYPGDKPYGTQWFNADRITSVNPSHIRYMLDTAAGQSGSPMWVLPYEGAPQGNKYVVGIHFWGGCPNVAIRITSHVWYNLKMWAKGGA